VISLTASTPNGAPAAVTVFLVMLALGLLLGYIGAGGAGLILATLALLGVPIHVAVGTSLAAMGFTTVLGVISHRREGNVQARVGLAAGAFGVAGALVGGFLALGTEPGHLKTVAGIVLLLSGLLMLVRFLVTERLQAAGLPERFWLGAALVGGGAGLLSGFLGIGVTALLQLGLLVFFRLTLVRTVGTSMLILAFISVAGTSTYLTAGLISPGLLVPVVAGTGLGSYLGAKFTRRTPELVLKTAVVLTAFLSGALVLRA
jgi:uncharacterized membrane protein YfcA